MLTVPIFRPLARGWVVGAVSPWPINTLEGEKLSFEGSLVDNVNVVNVGAGDDRLTATGTDCPSGTFRFVGSVIDPGETTVTLAADPVTLGMFVEAVILVAPNPTAVTGTSTLLAPIEMVTAAGTVAAPGLL